MEESSTFQNEDLISKNATKNEPFLEQKNPTKITLSYYDKNAKDFSDSTFEVEFTFQQNLFLNYLKKGDSILDFGCGAGRDSKYFLEKGFLVDAIDGSKEMCKIASKNTCLKVKNQLFSEFSETEKYSGIWACASLLHLQKSELKSVLKKLNQALKKNGILYASFKYGNFEGFRNERYFTDFTEKSFEDFLEPLKVFNIIQTCITTDVRKNRENEKWLNIILKKI